MSLSGNISSVLNCSSAAFSVSPFFGAEILSVEANLVQNYSTTVRRDYFFGHPTLTGTNLEFCNVTVAHTHPGRNDTLLTNIWLPATTWNGRLQAIGGGGMVAGMFPLSNMGMAGAVIEGYASVTINGGLPSEDAQDWALLSPGNANLYVLEDFASRGLADGTVIAKDVVRSFYGREAEYSYWSGCSQGGRQGMMLAQRYPTLFDGIHASAPAFNWNEFLVGDFWAQQVMNEFGAYPHPCELDALTTAAIDACDSLDGVVDGVISDIDGCKFDPYTMVGTSITCADTNQTLQITEAAAVAADAVWTGTNGTAPWYMPGYQANMTRFDGVGGTSCANGTCTGAPQALLTDWMSYFVMKDPDFDYSNMTREQYLDVYHAAIREYTSIIGTNDSNLTAFRNAGGKMITYHGLADQIIPFGNTRHYYDAVMAGDPDVKDYFRFFEAPGVGHCSGGAGALPDHTFYSLVDWVENGIVLTTLKATSDADANGNVLERILCPYPQKAKYDGSGNENSRDSWSCSA
ncbi:putative feruloyl esterase [Lasiodiplodia hormozganensis]|uniref:Carboxylic ester hydrolase n=1 Tax=Lasiodiplodia hormozganensis TaxID=869390 RepID=A0AA39XRG2_9PEZI|nr:putative feruloyl esterase [Lasiodiplodia hormozganensis]